MVYIGVDKTILQKAAKNYEFMWFPMALMEIPSCKPNEKYLVDCCINEYTEPKGVSRFFLINKIPSKVNILYAPTLRVPHGERKRCTFQEFVDDINYAIASLVRASKEFAQSSIKPSSLWKAAITSLIFPFRLVMDASMRQAAKMGDRLMYSVLRDILKVLCLDKKPLPEIRWNPVYVLVGVDFNANHMTLFVGNEQIRMRAYEKYVFKNEKLVEMIKSLTKKIDKS
ncbi:hypothetical protein J4526_09335 [Desulfurococcaceae archaeon MEX13E-LK6-19]|nr:hypothetical protein J4526_09335 [Desulfurococcaceae archaeon MEX13E-LK6-19]